MAVRTEKSTYKIITEDRLAFSGTTNTREEAFRLLLAFTKDLQYKLAVVIDFETEEEVVALRTIK